MMFLIMEQSLIALPLLIGAYITLSLLKLPDFSLESAYLFGAVAAVFAEGLPLPLVLLAAMCGGMVVGSVVSLLNQVFRFPFLLAAIVTNGLFHGLTQYMLGTSMVSFHPSLPISEMTLLGGIGAILLGGVGLLIRSQLGYGMAIYGNNPQFFHSHNMSGCYVVSFGVILGDGLAGISGFLFAHSNGFVDLSMNFGVLLLCLTSLIIGKLVIRNNRPNILIPLIGVLAYFVIQQSLLRVGLNLKYFNAFQALLIVVVLFMSFRKQQVKVDHLGV